MQIRYSRPAERDRLLEFIRENGFNPRDAETWDGLGMFAVTAWDGDELLGSIPLEPRELTLGSGRVIRTVHETVVAVREDQRSRGVGGQLQQYLREEPPDDVVLATVFREEPESGAYRWYVKSGFRPLVHIDSWFKDHPHAGDSDIPSYTVLEAQHLDASLQAELWSQFESERCGQVQRKCEREWRNWLAVHPYRKQYRFQVVKLQDGGGYALLGIGSMHSTTVRVDVLEFVVADDAAVGLMAAVCDYASLHELDPIRWPLVEGDPRTEVARTHEFERRWGFDFLVCPLVSDECAELDEVVSRWRYHSLDFA